MDARKKINLIEKYRYELSSSTNEDDFPLYDCDDGEANAHISVYMGDNFFFGINGFEKNEEKLEVIEYGNEEFKKIMSQRKNREGSQKEFCAYLGLLIKHFMEKGYTEDEAWEKACELWKTSFGSTGIAVEDQNSSCGLSYIGDDELNDYPKWLVFEV